MKVEATDGGKTTVHCTVQLVSSNNYTALLTYLVSVLYHKNSFLVSIEKQT